MANLLCEAHNMHTIDLSRPARKVSAWIVRCLCRFLIANFLFYKDNRRQRSVSNYFHTQYLETQEGHMHRASDSFSLKCPRHKCSLD